jgi:hypothetical protein
MGCVIMNSYRNSALIDLMYRLFLWGGIGFIFHFAKSHLPDGVPNNLINGLGALPNPDYFNLLSTIGIFFVGVLLLGRKIVAWLGVSDGGKLGGVRKELSFWFSKLCSDLWTTYLNGLCFYMGVFTFLVSMVGVGNVGMHWVTGWFLVVFMLFVVFVISICKLDGCNKMVVFYEQRVDAKLKLAIISVFVIYPIYYGLQCIN